MKAILLILLFLYSGSFAQSDLRLCPVAEGLGRVVDIANCGDERLFVVDQEGIIRVIFADGRISLTPFLDISGKVRNSGEQGLLGLAFHPDYESNGYFFVNYINDNQETVLARYQVSASDSSQADVNSEFVLITIPQPYTNHNGGDLNFGPDGYLYVSLGDGGSGGDPLNLGQNLTSPLGKILRIDVNEGTGAAPDYSGGQGYTIPLSNPLSDGAGGNLDEIWASGLRNPWRFSFDRQTGAMWIGDVGQGAWEEINLEPAGSLGGLNYGWRCYEGNHPYNTTGCEAESAYTFPIFEYNHSTGCSVNGGFVYRGADFPDLQGRYFYTDFCSTSLWALQLNGTVWENELVLNYASGNNMTTMGEDFRGELYLGSLQGRVFRMMDAAVLSGLPDLVLSDDPISNGSYAAGASITASGRVPAESRVSLDVFEGSIQLNQGFQAENGSVFLARTGSCAYTSN